MQLKHVTAHNYICLSCYMYCHIHLLREGNHHGRHTAMLLEHNVSNLLHPRNHSTKIIKASVNRPFHFLITLTGWSKNLAECLEIILKDLKTFLNLNTDPESHGRMTLSEICIYFMKNESWENNRRANILSSKLIMEWYIGQSPLCLVHFLYPTF